MTVIETWPLQTAATAKSVAYEQVGCQFGRLICEFLSWTIPRFVHVPEMSTLR
jgi:hypothetical protein